MLSSTALYTINLFLNNYSHELIIYLMHFINLGLILAGGVIVRQLARDLGILSINLIT